CVALSIFHVYTAGFGLLNEVMHRTIHLTFVMGLVFLVFPRRRADPTRRLWIDSAIFGTFYLYIIYDLVRALPASGLTYAFAAAMVGLTILTLPIKGRGIPGSKVALRDWLFAGLGAGFSLYLVVFFRDGFIANIGSPRPHEYMMCVIAIVI